MFIGSVYSYYIDCDLLTFIPVVGPVLFVYYSIVHFCFSGPVSKREWALLKGKMEVNTVFDKAMVYLEGPPAGVDLLASSFSIAPLKPEPVRNEIPCHMSSNFPPGDTLVCCLQFLCLQSSLARFL